MGDSWVVNLRHYGDVLGPDIPKSARRFGLFFGTIVEAATAGMAGLWRSSPVRCRRRPGRSPCPGFLQVLWVRDPGQVEWFCPACDDRGVIQGYSTSDWDLSNWERLVADGEEPTLDVLLREDEHSELREIVPRALPLRRILMGAESCPGGIRIVGHAEELAELLKQAESAKRAEAPGRRQQRLCRLMSKFEVKLGDSGVQSSPGRSQALVGTDAGSDSVDPETEHILRKLAVNRGYFPRQAVEGAIRRREQITPFLIAIVRNARDRISDIEPNFIGHIFALYLLAQFREERAFGPTVELFSIPGEAAVDATGSVATEDLHRILAAVAGGDDRRIKEVVEDGRLSVWVRSAAIRTLVTQVAWGQKSRKEVLEYFQDLLRTVLERKPSWVWTQLAICGGELEGEALLDDFRVAFEERLIDPYEASFEHLRKRVHQGSPDIPALLKERRTYRPIENTVVEMEWWACFCQDRAPELNSPAFEFEEGDKTVQPVTAQTTRSNKKTGRNNPCPCGSGIKFKKCCGAPR